MIIKFNIMEIFRKKLFNIYTIEIKYLIKKLIFKVLFLKKYKNRLTLLKFLIC